MNEKDFAFWILSKVESNDKMRTWYETHLNGKPLENTILTMEKAYFEDNGLTLAEITTLSIFIGLTTIEKETKQD